MSTAAPQSVGDEPVVRLFPNDEGRLETVQALWSSLEDARGEGRAIRKQQQRVDAEIERLGAEQEVLRSPDWRLEELTERIEEQIWDWERARSFHCFLRLPIELRGLIWDEYFGRDCVRRGWTQPITLVCKRVREEVVDWLLVNRPFHIAFSAFPKELDENRGLDSWLDFGMIGGEKDYWRSGRWIPEDLLARVRHVRVTARTYRFEMDWALNLFSGNVQVENTTTFGDAAMDTWALKYTKLVEERLQVVLRLIMKRGGLRRMPFQWLFYAVATRDAGRSEMERWLSRDRRTSRLALESLPFRQESIHSPAFS